MEAGQSRMRWTYDEFRRLPRGGTTRYEVIDGALALTPAPTSAHQQVVSNLVLILGGFGRRHELGRVLPGPIDVLFGEGDYLEPDLVFVRAERADVVSPRGVEAAPDLVVEVLSSSTAHRDRGIKLDRYRHFGVPEYWIVDPDRSTLEVWDLRPGAEASPRTLDRSRQLRWAPADGRPVLDVPVTDIFRDARPPEHAAPPTS